MEMSLSEGYAPYEKFDILLSDSLTHKDIAYGFRYA